MLNLIWMAAVNKTRTWELPPLQCKRGESCDGLCLVFFPHLSFISSSVFQMICPTAQKASPLKFSASMSPPWKGTPPTSSERSFELWGFRTPAPRGTNSELSSTRCVKVPFPCPSTQIIAKPYDQGDKPFSSQEVIPHKPVARTLLQALIDKESREQLDRARRRGRQPDQKPNNSTEVLLLQRWQPGSHVVPIVVM